MKIYTKAIIRSLFFTSLFLSLFVYSQAQAKKRKYPRRHREKYQTETIVYAKRYLVSKIEPDLPRQSFARWFRSLVGKKAKVGWQVNDCGEQTGDPVAGRGKDFPLCAEVNAAIGIDVWVRIFFQYGALRRGILPGKPVIKVIFIGREDEPTVSPKNLTDLSEKLFGIIGAMND